MSALKLYTLLAILAIRPITASIYSGSIITSLYYDCCKPACGWDGQAKVSNPVLTCNANDSPLTDLSAQSACDGGPASACTEQTAWAVNDTFSYGYGSMFIAGTEQAEWCCSCYEIEFTDSAIKGKRMIVQTINTNYNENQENWISLTVPGQSDWKGVCAKRFNGTYGDFFSTTTSPFVSVDQCEQVPESVRAGCEWRYTWYQNVNLPNATFNRVQCPKELTDKTTCVRDDDAAFVAETVSNSNSTTKSWATTSNSASTTLIFSVVLTTLLSIFATF